LALGAGNVTARLLPRCSYSVQTWEATANKKEEDEEEEEVVKAIGNHRINLTVIPDAREPGWNNGAFEMARECDQKMAGRMSNTENSYA
jgi:hypothetical protein